MDVIQTTIVIYLTAELCKEKVHQLHTLLTQELSQLSYKVTHRLARRQTH